MEEVVENVILPDGTRRVRIIGDVPISPLKWANALPDEALPVANIVPAEDKVLGIHSLTMTWPARDMLHEFIDEQGQSYKVRLVMWKLIDGDRVSMAIRYAADIFERAMGQRPGFAWIAAMPKGMDEFETVGGYVVDAVRVDGVSLRIADWAYPGCVFIGG